MSTSSKPHSKPQASIIVTSYNQCRTLNLMFASLERQTQSDFEIVIADDGSSDGTGGLCRAQKNLSVKFVTQPDEGYRKSKIVNQAVMRSASDYLIFLDGDVILERHFVEDHLRLRRPGHFVCGRRVDLGPVYSKNLTPSEVREGAFDGFNWKLFKSVFNKDSAHFNRSMRVKNPLIRKIFKYDRPIDILGSNFSAWREDVIQVNGFNEAIESYWGEDGDLFIRLRNSGKKPIGAKAVCVQFHVFHARREPTEENRERFYRLLKDTEYKWATEGIEKHAQPPLKT